MSGLIDQLALNIELDVEARFSTFFRGPNALVVDALANPQPPGLWLAGASGSGRSHLLQAAAAEAEQQAMYLPLKRNLPAAAIEGIAHGTIVCLDDIEQVAGDAQWERALFLLCEQINADGGALIVSAASRVADVRFDLPDLASRLSALPSYQMRPLSEADRLEALQQRAEQRGLDLPTDSARYMLSRLPRDLPALFAWLRLLDKQSLAKTRRLTVPFVSQVLREKRED